MNARWMAITLAAWFTAGSGQASADETLARLNGCLECHGEGEQDIGPPAADVALRYANVVDARDTLIEIVRNGGKGNWPEISRGAPMPPFGGSLSDDDIARLVDWMLGR